MGGSGHAQGTKAAHAGSAIGVTQEDPRVRAMLAVSGAVAGGGPTGDVLDQIAAQASFLTGVDGAGILEFGGDRFRIVGSFGLSEGYRKRLASWPMPLAPGRGPTGLAVLNREPVLCTDVTADPRFTDYAELVRPEGHRAIASTPLLFGGTVLGALTLYRKVPCPWEDEDVRVMTFFAEHAGIAIRTAHVMAEQQRQVAALERLVRRLREQAHEHANRIHAVAGLLATGEVNEAQKFVTDLGEAHMSDSAVFNRQSSRNALAGLLWAESILARQRSIALELDVTDDLDQLPLTDAQALTIVGNLLDNAMDNVSEMSGRHRRVRVKILFGDERATIEIEDWGPNPATTEDLFARGYSTKRDHPGVGLALVRDAVQAAHGQIDVEHRMGSAAFVVTLPLALQ
jgi:signal transduction histidine kinase